MDRNYKCTDEVLLEQASVIASHFEKDLSRFTRFDADLNQAKVEELRALISSAYHKGPDKLTVAMQEEYTEKMYEEMENCRVMFNLVRYWVLKAFPHRRAVQRQFGIGRFSRLSAAQPRLVEFMTELAETCEYYWSDLEAIGTPESFKEAVKQQATDLWMANLAQEQSKGRRTIETEERIERFNRIFDILKLLSSAAEFVFAHEPARREFFRPPGRNRTAARKNNEPATADKGLLTVVPGLPRSL